MSVELETRQHKSVNRGVSELVSRRTREGRNRRRRSIWARPVTSFALFARATGPSSVIIAVAATLFMLLRTMWPFTLGLADNGDGQRYICQLGLVPKGDVPRYWSFAILDWIPDQAYDANACIPYPSSHVILLRFAQWMTQLTGGAPGALDLRWLILANCLLVGILVGLFAFAIRRSLIFRVVGSVALLVVLSDGTFANYAGSIFGEYPGLAGVAIIAVGAIYLGTSGGKQFLGLALVAAGAVLALTSKTQGITLIIPLMVLLVCTTLRTRTRQETAAWWTPKRLLRILAGKVVPVAVGIGLILPVSWVLDNNPKDFQAINPWELISVGILGNSEDPAGDLEEMGFPRELAKYAGDSVWEESNIMASPDWEPNTHLMNYETAARFLLAHPDRAAVIANNAGNDYFMTRPTYLGAFTQDSGQKAQAYDYSFVADLGMQATNMGITPLIMFWGALSTGAIVMLKRSAPGTFRRGFATATLLMIGFSIIQFFTASFGEAIENTKHMVYGILAGALAPVLLITGALTTRRSDGRRAHREARYKI
jgi:hypothetical protein